MPARFGGVGAWRVRSNFPVFLRSRDRGSEDAVFFAEIGGNGYFDQTGSEFDSNCRYVKRKGASRKTQICRLHDISAKAEIACLPAFPDGPEKLRSLKITEFSVFSYFLTKRGQNAGAFVKQKAG